MSETGMSARVAVEVAGRLQAVSPPGLTVVGRDESVVFTTSVPRALPDGSDFVEQIVENVPMDSDDCETLVSNLGGHLYGVLDEFQNLVIELLRDPWPVAEDGTLARAYTDVEGETVRLGFATRDELVIDLGILSVPELGECDERP